MKEATNAAVLVIDDEELVRNDIEEILMPRKTTAENESVGLAASILFDTPSPSLKVKKVSNIPNFTVHKASNGMEGLEMVKKINSCGHPICGHFFRYAYARLGWHGNS